MAKIPGLNITAPVVPSQDTDTYPSHRAIYGYGGWREVATVADRDAIPSLRRESGMSVYVTSEQKLYVLQDDLVTWNEFKSGSTDSVRKTDDLSTFVPMVNGEIVEYTGTTTQNYTQGYFYKVTENITYTDASGILVGGNLSNLEVDVDVFVNSGVSLNEDHIIHYSVEQESWLDADNNPVDLVAWGVSVEGEVEDNDSMNIRVNSTTTYPATRVDVQPDQTFTLNQKTLPQVGKNVDLPVVEQRTSLTLYSTEEHDAHLGEIVQYIGNTYEANGLYHGYFYQWTHEQIGEHTGVYYWKQWNVQPGTTVIDNVTTQSSTEALSANQGYLLNERINALDARGRFLSGWDSQTGLATTNPPQSPYTYKNGDYFIVSNAVVPEPESCTSAQISGETISYGLNEYFYKQKVGTTVDRYDIFSYTEIETEQTGGYGNATLSVSNQSKYDEYIANAPTLIAETNPDYTIVEVTGLQIWWQGYGYANADNIAMSYIGDFTYPNPSDPEGEPEHATSAGHQSFTITRVGTTLEERKTAIRNYLLEKTGLYICGEIIFGNNPWDGQEMYVTSNPEHTYKWTFNGEDLPEGETLQDYGLYINDTVEGPVSIAIIYRTLKQNYKPDGSTYTTGVASTVVEENKVHANDTYLYDGSNWSLLSSTQEVSFEALEGSPYDNVELANALDAKVDDVQIKGAGDSGYRSVVTDKIAKIDLVSQGVDYTFDAVPSVTSVKDALDDLMNRQYYKEPSFSTFTTNKSGSYERQPSAISDITFSWTLNKTPATGDVLQIRTGTNGGTSGDLVYDIMANEPSSNWKSGTYNYSSFTTTNTNKSFHIYYQDNHSVVPSGKSSSTNANTSITFYIKKYYGASALEEPTAAQIKALKNATSSRTLAEEEFNFGDGKYWYYCIPKETDSGAALKFSIGAKGAESPQSGNYFIYEMNDFTNAQGYTVPLRIYKFKKTPAGLPDKITGSSYVKVD